MPISRKHTSRQKMPWDDELVKTPLQDFLTLIKALPDAKNPLNRVNQVHARMKDFLNAHSSFNRDSLQGYLNLFTFAINPPVGYLEKVEELLILTFKVRKTLRYRDFYAVK